MPLPTFNYTSSDNSILKKPKVVLTGSSGMIGRALIPYLEAKGYTVITLKRPQDWDPTKDFIQTNLLEGCEAVIHLAGATIAQRWTIRHKTSIYESRIQGTTLLARTLYKLKQPPKTFIVASGISIYGTQISNPTTENASINTKTFLGALAYAIETHTSLVQAHGIRAIYLRMGAVLSPTGGMLQKLLPIFKYNLGCSIGSGQQLMNWISLQDVLQVIVFTIETPEVQGAVNLVAPQVVTNEAFSHTLAKAINRKCLFRIPAWFIQTFLGQFANETALSNQHVIPQKLLDHGYLFTHENLSTALNEILGS